MAYSSSVELVNAFWRDVWIAQDPAAVDRFVTADFVLTDAGTDIVGRENFASWLRALLETVRNLDFEVIETFQNADGSRVASRWRISGRNNGMFGTAPDGEPISLTGMAVWHVSEDGKLSRNWVERAAWEQIQRLGVRPTP